MAEPEASQGARDRTEDEIIRLRARVHGLANDQHAQALVIARLETVVGTLRMFVYGLIGMVLTGVGAALLSRVVR